VATLFVQSNRTIGRFEVLAPLFEFVAASLNKFNDRIRGNEFVPSHCATPSMYRLTSRWDMSDFLILMM
jgi:hypothetical protein